MYIGWFNADEMAFVKVESDVDGVLVVWYWIMTYVLACAGNIFVRNINKRYYVCLFRYMGRSWLQIYP
jgi:hypothetical protein